MYTVVSALYPAALASSITLPMEILQAASQMASASVRGQPQVNFLMASAGGDEVDLASGFSLAPSLALEELPQVDLLLLPAIWRNPQPTVRAATPWLAQLPKLAAAGTRICSVGTASCLLAQAGMLDGKPATTHWNYFEEFTRRYPAVELKTRHLITQSEQLYCVGSVNSIADLMVHIVELWFGSRIARAVENQFSPEIRQAFGAAAYQDEPGSAHHDETVLEGQQWIASHLNQSIRIADLAAALDLSTRTLSRRFRQATGLSPQAYLTRERLATARTLLRNSNLSLGEVAWQVGLQDLSYFSSLFRRHNGMSPVSYRQAVRGKLFAPEDGHRPATTLEK